MVNSQARRLVPGSNLSRLVQALIRVSCTRSSASEELWLSDQAKARRAGISCTTESRQSESLAESFPVLEGTAASSSAVPGGPVMDYPLPPDGGDRGGRQLARRA